MDQNPQFRSESSVTNQSNSRRRGRKHRKSQPGESKLPTFVYSEEKMIEGLVKYIASAELPLSIAEDVRFEKFMQSIQPAFHRVPRTVIISECLRVFEQMKRDLIDEFSRLNGTISVVSEMWSSCDDGPNYICVTAHFIDCNWIMQKRIIAFRTIQSFCDVVQEYELMIGVFREYHIVDKVFKITYNRITTGDVVIANFEKYLHPYHGGRFSDTSICDAINSFVKDGLELIEDHISRIRSAVIFITRSNDRLQEFFSLCKSYGLKSTKLKPDLGTCWNSTFLMLQSCVKYDVVISDYYNSKYDNYIVRTNDWEISFAVMEFLEVFHNATNVFSGVYYPTSCTVLTQLCNISHFFAKYKDSSKLEDVYRSMTENLKSYCRFLSPVFCLAATMDPRIKLDGVKLLLDEISENLSMSLPIYVNDITILLNSVYNVYESKFAKEMTTSFPSSSQDYSWSVISKKKQSTRTQLDRYLEDDFMYFLSQEEGTEFDILAWWKSNEKIFPVLSIMARDLLTPPVSTILSSSVSNWRKRILNFERSMQPCELLESLFFIKDRDDAQFRAQGRRDDMVDAFANLDLSDEGNDQ